MIFLPRLPAYVVCFVVIALYVVRWVSVIAVVLNIVIRTMCKADCFGVMKCPEMV